MGYEYISYISATRTMLEIADIHVGDSDQIWFSGDQRIRATLTDISVARKLTGCSYRTCGNEGAARIRYVGLWWAKFQRIHSRSVVRLWMRKTDLWTQELFREEYGIDIFTDRSVSDLVSGLG